MTSSSCHRGVTAGQAGRAGFLAYHCLNVGITGMAGRGREGGVTSVLFWKVFCKACF